MSRLVVFLRAINTAGHSVKIERVEALFAELGFAGVHSYLANGNVIVDTKSASGLAIEQRVERKVQPALGADVVAFARTLDEVRAMPAAVPFDAAERKTAASVQVGLLKHPPAADAVQRLHALQTTNDRLAVVGRELYWLSRIKERDAPLRDPAIEKALGMQTTFRAIAMMERLVEHSAA